MRESKKLAGCVFTVFRVHRSVDSSCNGLPLMSSAYAHVSGSESQPDIVPIPSNKELHLHRVFVIGWVRALTCV